MEELHPEALCPLPLPWPIEQPLIIPDRADNQQYAFISARFVYMEKKAFPVSITIMGNEGEILMNTIVYPRSFIKHYATDTHDLREDDIMRGLDHYIAFPLLKTILANKTIVGYHTRKTLECLEIPLKDINTYIDITNLIPTTSHYAEVHLQNLAKQCLSVGELPIFLFKATLIEAALVRKIFRHIKQHFITEEITKNPFTHLVTNIKDQGKSQKQFKLPVIPNITRTIPNRQMVTVETSSKRRSPPPQEEIQYPPKNRKDTRIVHLADKPSTSKTLNPYLRPQKTMGFIQIKPPIDTIETSPRRVLSYEEVKEIRQQIKPDSTPQKPKETRPPKLPVGPQNYLQHPFTLMGIVELNTNFFLSNLEAMATKKEATTLPHKTTTPQSSKDDPATVRMNKIKDYIKRREKKTPDPGHPSVILSNTLNSPGTTLSIYSILKMTTLSRYNMEKFHLCQSCQTVGSWKFSIFRSDTVDTLSKISR